MKLRHAQAITVEQMNVIDEERMRAYLGGAKTWAAWKRRSAAARDLAALYRAVVSQGYVRPTSV